MSPDHPSSIEPPNLALAREFRDRPIGRHSHELTALLGVLRSGAVTGKYCLICVRPYEQWVIAQLSGRRGEPPAVQDNRVFQSIEDAEWAVFKLRWREAFAVSLDEDAL